MKFFLLLAFCNTVAGLYNYCLTTGVSCTATGVCSTGTCVYRDSKNKVCCPTASLACRDLTDPSTGVSTCSGQTAYCTNSAYYTLMTQQCPVSCGFCGLSSSISTSTSCVDLVNPSTGVSECSTKSYLCSNSQYYQVMLVQCPRTCGFCTASSSVISSSTTCYNLGTDCPTRAATGYCTNSYYVTLMRQQCPLACGYCTVGK